MVIMILSYEPSISLHMETQHTWLVVPDTDSLVVKKIWLFINCVQLQGFPIEVFDCGKLFYTNRYKNWVLLLATGIFSPLTSHPYCCQVYSKLLLIEIEHRYWLLGFVAQKYSHMNITPLSATFMVIFYTQKFSITDCYLVFLQVYHMWTSHACYHHWFTVNCTSWCLSETKSFHTIFNPKSLLYWPLVWSAVCN